MTFHAMTENLVKEDAGGASAEDRRPDERLRLRGLQQLGYIVGDAIDSGEYGLLVCQAVLVDGFEGFEGGDVRAIDRLSGGVDHDAGEAASVRDARALVIHEVARIGLAEHSDVAGEHARIVAEPGGVAAHTVLPLSLVELEFAGRLD